MPGAIVFDPLPIIRAALLGAAQGATKPAVSASYEGEDPLPLVHADPEHLRAWLETALEPTRASAAVVVVRAQARRRELTIEVERAGQLRRLILAVAALEPPRGVV